MREQGRRDSGARQKDRLMTDLFSAVRDAFHNGLLEVGPPDPAALPNEGGPNQGCVHCGRSIAATLQLVLQGIPSTISLIVHHTQGRNDVADNSMVIHVWQQMLDVSFAQTHDPHAPHARVHP